MLLRVKRLNQLAIHQQEQVQALHVGRHVRLPEVRVEFLQCEVLEDLLALGDEETTNLLNSALLLEELGVLKFCSMGRVVSHQVLC